MSKISIVVVDDNEIDRYVVKRLIKGLKLDADFVEFTDGEDFLAVLRDKDRVRTEIGTTPPKFLILLDVNMPRKGGFEVLEAINSEPGLDGDCMFVSMYTSSSRLDDQPSSEQYPFVKDHIVKPLTSEKLTAVVENLYA